ncbi:hypothetical protein [Bradyrhizobium sp. SZCCHNS3053]|uniref:hypothetical protein n=1 Tax=Bradyrhizobium sp. SZCCHNS3053 TaxID=3057322 RepID=UPI0029166E4E|nr:hypothetical protein [Bradyrhizobium sp. SZCCHNS3053]
MADLPLFASDDELGEAVLGWERRGQFRALAELHERSGFPKVHPIFGGRYVPAVKHFLDSMHGLAPVLPLAPDGKEGTFHVERKKPIRMIDPGAPTVRAR